MTVLFSRRVAGSATHAFVIGVGNFPYAAAGATPELKDVPNLPSAADSAKLMCDWLIANGDNLVAPLASLEVLISDPPERANRYPWAPAKPVDRATPRKVQQAGERWLRNFPAGSANTAFFYGCGHGASLTADAVLFLEELNRRPSNPWPNIQVTSLARSLRLHPHIECAFIFIDACGQKVAEFELCPPDNRLPTVFYAPAPYGAVGANKVMLMSAAPEGQLAYDAPLSSRYAQPPAAGVPIGRFTQTLLMALNGSSVRNFRNRWAVNSTGLSVDLKPLKQFYFPNLTDYPFEPTPIYMFNDVRPFAYPASPVVPIVVTTNPTEKIDLYEFCIKDTPPPPPPDGGMPHDPVRKAWFGEVPPRNSSVFAVAFNPEGFFTNQFTPNQPQFDLQVDIP